MSTLKQDLFLFKPPNSVTVLTINILFVSVYGRKAWSVRYSCHAGSTTLSTFLVYKQTNE